MTSPRLPSLLGATGPVECDRCGEEVRVMGHVCDLAKVEARKAEAMAIGASGVDEDAGINWEEAIKQYRESEATVLGREQQAAPQPERTLGLTYFEWRILWMLASWGVLLFIGGLILGALFKRSVLT